MPAEPELKTALVAAATSLRAGRYGDAIDRFEAVLAERPELPDTWYNLAWAQRANRRFADALASYAQAIAHGMDQPEEAHLNRAAILSDHLAATDRALDEIEAALAINPSFVSAWLSRGNIYEDLGDVAAARAAYAGALALDPANGRALARTAAIDLFEDRQDEARRKLEAALPHAATLPDRADILYALGGVFEAQGGYRGAYDAVEAANAIAGSIAPMRYDRAGQERAIDRMIAAFPVAPSPPADDGIAPIFICGMFRSGSTLVEQILGRHSGITAAGERETIPALAHAIDPYPEAAAALSPQEIQAYRTRYRAEMGIDGIATDKRCDNFMHIGLIKTLFPTAQIVHTVRQPLDNLMSIFFLNFGDAIVYGYKLDDIAHFYAHYRRLMDHWRRLFPDSIHDVDYDELVKDPRAVAEDLLSRLGLPWEDACLNAGTVGKTVQTASAWQVRKPLHAGSSGRWHHHADRIEAVRARLEESGLL